jgi:hypothetical protein
MNEQFPIVKSLGTLYEALYTAKRLNVVSFLAKNIFPLKIILFFSVAI